jgi:hypothetical protein
MNTTAKTLSYQFFRPRANKLGIAVAAMMTILFQCEVIAATAMTLPQTIVYH